MKANDIAGGVIIYDLSGRPSCSRSCLSSVPVDVLRLFPTSRAVGACARTLAGNHRKSRKTAMPRMAEAYHQSNSHPVILIYQSPTTRARFARIVAHPAVMMFSDHPPTTAHLFPVKGVIAPPSPTHITPSLFSPTVP